MIYGRIYKIFCNITGEYYYGSTEQTLAQRLSVHKSNYKGWKKGKREHYTTSYKIIERGNYTISLLEEGEFQNKDFMKARECYYIENFECVNKNVPNRTEKEWREANKERIKEYLQANKERIAEQTKAYREANKERIAEQEKAYREANKERIAEQKKAYREAHREAHREKIREKYTCECGSVICRGEKARHEKTKKHLAIKN